jgi:hypothetical protein
MTLHSFSHAPRLHSPTLAQWSLAIAVLLTIVLTVLIGRYQQTQPMPYWVPIAQGGGWEALAR